MAYFVDDEATQYTRLKTENITVTVWCAAMSVMHEMHVMGI